MTVKIRRKKLRFSFTVPVSLVLFGMGKSGKIQGKLDKRTKREIKDGFKRAKKHFGRLTVVDVQASDGTKVKITL